jgi:D-threonate/D-erythronate kinase
VKTAASAVDRAAWQVTGEQSGQTVAQAVGALVRDILIRMPLSTLVIFGGDTAFGVVDCLGIGSIQPVREIVQGVVVSRTERGGRELHLITKAGGFGTPDILIRIREAMRKEQ